MPALLGKYFSWNLPKDLTISLREDFFAFHNLKQIICAKEIILHNFSFVEDNQSTGGKWTNEHLKTQYDCPNTKISDYKQYF